MSPSTTRVHLQIPSCATFQNLEKEVHYEKYSPGSNVQTYVFVENLETYALNTISHE